MQAGRSPVGYVSELDAIRAASVLYLRLWCDGASSRGEVCNDLRLALGSEQGQQAIANFEALCDLCRTHGRRPLMRHSVTCKCLGSDESCFANFVATAAEGEREDAMLIATLLVRPDVAPMLVAMAAEFGLALKRMRLGTPKAPIPSHPVSATLH